MASQPMTVGHTANMQLAFFDQDHNPMQDTPTPDSPPTWADDTPTVGTLTAASNGLSATEVTIAAGTDTVTCTIVVGGTTFTATQELDVSAAPQVLTSVEIVTTVQ